MSLLLWYQSKYIHVYLQIDPERQKSKHIGENKRCLLRSLICTIRGKSLLWCFPSTPSPAQRLKAINHVCPGGGTGALSIPCVCRGLQWGHLSAPSQGEPWWLFHDSFPDNTNLLNFSMFSRGRGVPPAPICAYEIDPHFDRNKELHRKRKNEKTRKTVVLSKGKQGRENRGLLQHTENGLPIFYMTVIPRRMINPTRLYAKSV